MEKKIKELKKLLSRSTCHSHKFNIKYLLKLRSARAFNQTDFAIGGSKGGIMGVRDPLLPSRSKSFEFHAFLGEKLPK